MESLNLGLEETAKEAYRVYGQTTNFKNYQGLQMPEWEQLPEKIRLAWQTATKAIIERVK